MYRSWDNPIPRKLDNPLVAREDSTRDGPSQAGCSSTGTCVPDGHVITFAQRCPAPGWDMSTWRLP